MLRIVETVASVWFYHLAEEDVVLCSDTGIMMPTSIPLDTWGLKTHLNEKYCQRCDAVYRMRPI